MSKYLTQRKIFAHLISKRLSRNVIFETNIIGSVKSASRYSVKDVRNLFTGEKKYYEPRPSKKDRVMSAKDRCRAPRIFNSLFEITKNLFFFYKKDVMYNVIMIV